MRHADMHNKGLFFQSIFTARTDPRTGIAAEPSKGLCISSSCREGPCMGFYLSDTSSADKANCALATIGGAKDHLQRWGCEERLPPPPRPYSVH